MKGFDYCCLITCEHGGNRVPIEYQPLFKGKQQLLKSHRAWDPGALILAKELAGTLQGKLVYSTTTRLLIDLNRSAHHPGLYSDALSKLDRTKKETILKKYYQPYRNQVENYIRQQVKKGKTVTHFSVHSFTPKLSGKSRDADIGLLYDPARRYEKDLCDKLQKTILQKYSGIKVRKNYPYRGTADGFTTYLRKEFPGTKYLGVELELNQKHVAGDKESWKKIRKSLTSVLREVCEERSSR